MTTLEEVKNNYLLLAEEEPERFILVDAKMEAERLSEFVAGEIRKRAGQEKGDKK